jgi:hypothetical protein
MDILLARRHDVLPGWCPRLAGLLWLEGRQVEDPRTARRAEHHRLHRSLKPFPERILSRERAMRMIRVSAFFAEFTWIT